MEASPFEESVPQGNSFNCELRIELNVSVDIRERYSFME